MNVLIVLGVLMLIVAGVMWFLVALKAIDSRPTHVVQVERYSSLGDQLEAEFRALDLK